MLVLKEFTKPHACVGLSICVLFKIKRLRAGEVAWDGRVCFISRRTELRPQYSHAQLLTWSNVGGKLTSARTRRKKS